MIIEMEGNDPDIGAFRTSKKRGSQMLLQEILSWRESYYAALASDLRLHTIWNLKTLIKKSKRSGLERSVKKHVIA